MSRREFISAAQIRRDLIAKAAQDPAYSDRYDERQRVAETLHAGAL